MKKDLLKIGIVSLIAATLFYLNPVQDSEIDARLSNMCLDNPQIPCEYVVDYCEQNLRKGIKCYIISE